MVLLLGWPRPSSGWAATYCARSLMLQWVCPARRRIDLGRFLAGQHQQSRLDVGVVLAWRRTLGTILEAIQALLRETMAPQPDGADRQTQVLGDGAIGLAVRGAQDDLGTVGILLGGGAGSRHGAPVRSARPPAAEFEYDAVWTCERWLSVFPITTGSPPHVFHMRFNQQEGVLVGHAAISW